MSKGDQGGDAQGYFDLSTAGAEGGGSVISLDDLASYEIAGGLFFRPFFAQSLSINLVTFPPDGGFPTHVHPEEQISIVQEGEMEITIADVLHRVKPGDLIHFPPSIPHSGRTGSEACRLIDIFAPPRTGIWDVIADADPVRAADVDRWWYRDR